MTFENMSQAIQDSFCLASTIYQHNSNCHQKANPLSTDSNDEKTSNEPESLKVLLNQYEKVRWAPTTSITLKAIFLGYLETGSRGFLSKFRDAFFFFAGKIGLAKKVFLDAATPQLK